MKTAFILLLTPLIFTLSASAAPKDLSALFPDLPGASSANTVYALSSPEYQAFDRCRKSTTGTDCDPSRPPRFFRLTNSPGTLNEPYTLVNRCLEITPITENKAARGDIILSGGKVECKPAPDTVHIAHLLLCYEKASGVLLGAHCSFATICFEGERVRGRCIRDYPAEEIQVWHTVGP